jgi:hypothetical protein
MAGSFGPIATDMAIVEETHAPTTRNGLHDLLTALLAAETGELLHRSGASLHPISEELASPHGRIFMDNLICQGGRGRRGFFGTSNVVLTAI